jgi:hypothetical protein
MYFLIFFATKNKIINVVAVDQIVCVEFLNPKVDPILFNTILRTMVHCPCGPHNLYFPCMKDARCSKQFLEGFQELTSMDADGYPLYIRRNNIGQGYATRLVDD